MLVEDEIEQHVQLDTLPKILGYLVYGDIRLGEGAHPAVLMAHAGLFRPLVFTARVDNAKQTFYSDMNTRAAGMEIAPVWRSDIS